MDIFSTRLKWLRESKGYTHKKMADLLGMSQPGYSKVEYGQRELSFDKLAKLPDILGESTDFLLGITDFQKDLEKAVDALNEYRIRMKHDAEQMIKYFVRKEEIEQAVQVEKDEEKRQELISRAQTSKMYLEQLALEAEKLKDEYVKVKEKVIARLEEVPMISDESKRLLEKLKSETEKEPR